MVIAACLRIHLIRRDPQLPVAGHDSNTSRGSCRDGRWVLSCLGLLALSTLCQGTAKPALAGNQIWSGSGPRAKSIQAIARDPLNPSRMWAATLGAGVYRSLDGGATWTAYRDSLTNTFVRCLAVNPVHPDSVFCGTNDGVFLSTDGGVAWKQNLPTIWSVRSITMHPFRRSILYAATYGSGIYKSFNGGATWGTINLGLVNTKVRDVAIHPANPETLFAATSMGGGVHFSFNGGLSWTQVGHHRECRSRRADPVRSTRPEAHLCRNARSRSDPKHRRRRGLEADQSRAQVLPVSFARCCGHVTLRGDR